MDLTPITDFFTNIKEKITNPFFGTLILVTLSRNWSLAYSLFNFNANDSRDYKLKYISDYLAQKNFKEELLINVSSSALIVVVGYLIVILFKTLSIWIEANAMPHLTNFAASKQIVLKDVYDVLKEERDDYAERYEEQRKRVRDYSKYNDSLISNEQEQSKRNSQLVSEIAQLEEKNRNEKDELNAYYENIIENEKNNSSTITENLKILENLLEETKNNNTLEINTLSNHHDFEREKLEDEITKLKNRILELDVIYQNQQFATFSMQHSNNLQNKIIILIDYISKRYPILEYHDNSNNLYFFDIQKLEFIPNNEMSDILNTVNYEYELDPLIVNAAITKMKPHIEINPT